MNRRNGRSFHAITGGACEALCIWEPFVVRSTREARALATNGCALAGPPSPALQTFLRACCEHGAPAFEAGRISLYGKTGAELRRLWTIRTLAMNAGLSYLDGLGIVRVRLRLHGGLDLATALRVLAAGDAERVTLRAERMQLSVRHEADGFHARIRGDLAYERLDTSPHAAARSLSALLSATQAAPSLDAALLPPSAVRAIAHAVCPEHCSFTSPETLLDHEYRPSRP